MKAISHEVQGINFSDSFPEQQTKTVDAVVVGADRVCANGDTANKIGTYTLSIVAAFHGVPFYVAAPVTSLDVNLSSGDAIPIEEVSMNIEVAHQVVAPHQILIFEFRV